MKLQDFVALSIILVGLASAVWQIDRLVGTPKTEADFVSILSQTQNECARSAVLCATEGLLCESSKVTVRFVGETVKQANNLVRFASIHL